MNSWKDFYEIKTNKESSIGDIVLEHKELKDLEKLSAQRIKEVEQKIYESGIEGYVLENLGVELKVVKTQDRTESDVVKEVDYEKALEFAKKNNLTIPTITKIDYSKLEQQDWFQENVESFTKKSIVDRKVRGVKRLLWGKIK